MLMVPQGKQMPPWESTSQKLVCVCVCVLGWFESFATVRTGRWWSHVYQVFAECIPGVDTIYIYLWQSDPNVVCVHLCVITESTVLYFDRLVCFECMYAENNMLVIVSPILWWCVWAGVFVCPGGKDRPVCWRVHCDFSSCVPCWIQPGVQLCWSR